MTDKELKVLQEIKNDVLRQYVMAVENGEEQSVDFGRLSLIVRIETELAKAAFGVE